MTRKLVQLIYQYYTVQLIYQYDTVQLIYLYDTKHNQVVICWDKCVD